ncbi:MAG: alpha/beta fold hydrolase [Clostridium sp.]
MKIKLHYEEKGTGQPMVLLHGNGEDSSYFKNQIEYFSKNTE